MKNLKKLASVALALVMTMALMVPAFAAPETVPTEGSITIQHAVNGETYKIVKLFNAKVSTNATATTGMTYTMPGDNPSAIPSTLTAYFEWDSALQTIKMKDGATELSPAAQTALKTWAEGVAAGYPENSPNVQVAGAGGSVTFSDVDLGYYVVLSSVNDGAAIAVTNTNPDATVYEKNAETPQFTDGGKKVVDAQGNRTDVTYAVGSVLNFKVDYSTVNWNGSGETAEQITKYTVNDNLANGALTLQGEITVEIFEGTNTTPTSTQTFTGFPFDVNWVNGTNSLYANGAKLVVSYSAKVNRIVANGVENIITITPDKGTPSTDNEKVYTATVNISKVDANTDAPLNDAEFALYRKNANGEREYLIVDNTSNEVSWSAAATTAPANAYKVTTSGNGTASIAGLASGIYYLEETVAPQGYNRIDNNATGVEETMKIEVGKMLDADLSVPMTVENTTGTVLPSTGGMGTTIFYVVGGVLLVGSAILFVTKKRMGE